MLQFIHDNRGNTTGVFIPIEEWQSLKNKYTELQKEENELELADWQKKIIDERLTDYYQNSDQTEDFDNTVKDIENNL